MRTIPVLPESKRAEVVAAARSFKDVRWRHQGRSRRGVDCIGLLSVTLAVCAVEAQDVRGYERVGDGVQLRDGMIERFGAPVSEWREGNPVLMRWRTTNGVESHVGILAKHNDEWTLIHAHARDKRVVEHRIDAVWANRITDVFSLTGAVE